MARASKRDDVLDKADELFEKNGFVATGVNQITQEAGVASMTLYNNFKSKKELIVAALERRSERFFEQLDNSMSAAGPAPRERILAAFDALDAWIVTATKRRKGFSGCTFVKASIEFSAPSHPAHRVAAAHKRRIVALFEDAARDMKHKSPQNLALQLQHSRRRRDHTGSGARRRRQRDARPGHCGASDRRGVTECGPT